MSPPYEAQAAVVSTGTRERSHEDLRRQVLDRWTAGEPLPVIACNARLPLEDIEGILLAVLFDFG